MNKKYFAFYLIFSLAVIGCGGGGGSANPFDALPDLTPAPALTGNWSITETTDKTSCTDLFPIGRISDGLGLLIDSAGNCQLDSGSMVGFENSSCETGGDQVVVVVIGKEIQGDCTISIAGNYSFQLDNESALTGIFAATDYSSTGDCTEQFGTKSVKCSFSGTATAVLNNN